jgi:hypothetical protein
MRQRNLDYARQERDFYPTPAWVMEALLRRVPLPNGIWESCCGDGAMAQVLESHGHRVVGTDLMTAATARRAGTSWMRPGCPMASPRS